ncbi:MAG TPA: hypothetical protein VK678_08150, partial [Bradyrhizobium sp.]|nr:hypothetical protein [Bradyrhizobium sp.]
GFAFRFFVVKKVAGGSHSEKPATAANPYFRWPAELLVGCASWRAIASRQSWSIDFYDGQRVRCVICDTLKVRPTDIDGAKRPDVADSRGSIEAVGGEFTDLALDGSSVDVAGQSRGRSRLAAATHLGVLSTPQLAFAYASARRAFTSASSSSP